MTGYIYALTCPDTGFIRYVGKTKNDPLVRFIQHIQTVKTYQRDSGHPLYHWIEYLMLQNKYPAIIILTECPVAELEEKELFYYLKYRPLGLFNKASPSKAELKKIDRAQLFNLLTEKQIDMKAFSLNVGVGQKNIIRFLSGEPTNPIISIKKAFQIEKYILAH